MVMHGKHWPSKSFAAASTLILCSMGCEGTLVPGKLPTVATVDVTPAANRGPFLSLAPTTADQKRSVIRVLTRAEASAAIVDAFGTKTPLPADLGTEANYGTALQGVTLDTAAFTKLFLYAESAAVTVAARVRELVACPNYGTTECVTRFVTERGTVLFRRPMAAAEIADFTALFVGALPTEGETGAYAAMLTSMLASSNLWYQVEYSNELTASELGARLSISFLGMPPDAALRTSIGAGTVLQPEGFQRELTRLSSSPQHAALLTTVFLRQFDIPQRVGTELNDLINRDAQLVISDLVESGGTLKDLLTTGTAFVNARLSSQYQLAPVSGEALQKRQLDPALRQGVLSFPAFMLNHSSNGEQKVTLLGKFVRERLLCQSPVPPPANVSLVIEPPQSGRSLRERHAAHRDNPACSSCHAVMDPVGFLFLSHSPVGAGLAPPDVDATGELTFTDVDGPLNGVVELGKRLSNSKQVARCMVSHWLQHTFRRAQVEAEQGLVERVADQWVAQGGVLRDLPRLFAADSDFRRSSL
jgi:hypothetical protein